MRARARATAELAAQGLYQCMGRCRKIYPLAKGIVVTWGGNVLFAVCPECFPEIPVVLKRKLNSNGQQAIYVGPLKEADRPADIVPASSLSQVSEFVSKDALAKFKRSEP